MKPYFQFVILTFVNTSWDRFLKQCVATFYFRICVVVFLHQQFSEIVVVVTFRESLRGEREQNFIEFAYLQGKRTKTFGKPERS